MDGVGSPAVGGAGARLHSDDANYSPSQTPPLLQNVSGNDSSSGSPSGSRRHGSTGEREKKNREERLRLIKERQEQEHEKRLAELKAAYEKETRVRQMKDAERLRRIQEIKMKEAHRRQAVEERRRRLETEDKEKREQILAKYKEYEHKLSGHRDQKKPIYAFGSSTPRTLAYLEHLENSMRVYNSRLASGSGVDDELSSAKGASAADKRATSACSLTRKSLTASSSPNLSPLHLHQQQRGKITSGMHHHQQHVHQTSRPTKPMLAPSGRWGGSMVASMYGGSAALSTSNAHSGGGGGVAVDRDPLANVRGMTTSFAVGETSVAPHTKNVRAKGALSPSSARSQSTTRLTRVTSAPRKARQPDVITEENEDGTGVFHVITENQKSSRSVSKRGGGLDGGEGASDASEPKQKPRAVSTARTPSAPPPAIRRPAPSADAASKVAAPASSSKSGGVAKEKAKPPLATKAQIQKQQQTNKESSEPVKIIRKPKASSPETPSGLVSPPADGTVTAPDAPASALEKPSVAIGAVDVDQSANVVSSPVVEANVNVGKLSLEHDHLCEQNEFVAPTKIVPENEGSYGTTVVAAAAAARNESPVFNEAAPADTTVVEHQENPLDASTADMNGSTVELVASVPKPTGQGAGKVLSKEEAAAALAERRRLAREQIEREKELERQREEQRRLAEEEARRREEEEFRRQEEEELRMLEEARRGEEERIRRMIEEEEKRREIEAKQLEEEQRKKAEAEARARDEADRADRERKEAEEKFKKEEQERLERKKRLEAIMQRTRQTGTPAGNSSLTPTSVTKHEQTGGAISPVFANGSNEHVNDTSIYVTPAQERQTPSDTPAHSSSSSVLMKLANVRPEVGRSLETILNRVKSTPNVSGVENSSTTTTTTTSESRTTTAVMTSSFSADKVSQSSPRDGETRLSHSFYATPGREFGGGKGFNYSGPANVEDSTERTEYDIDASATKSQSHYARILTNEDAASSDARTNGAMAASISVLGIDPNANQQNRTSNNLVKPTNLMDFTGDMFDHNENANGGEGDRGPISTTRNGHGAAAAAAAEGMSASDSDASSAVTIIHQMMSPRETPVDDSFSSPRKSGGGILDDLINDNVSTPDDASSGVQQTASKPVQSVASHSAERSLMDF